jgi:hypothetical protein
VLREAGQLLTQEVNRRRLNRWPAYAEPPAAEAGEAGATEVEDDAVAAGR